MTPVPVTDRKGFWIAVGAVGFVAAAALVTFVLIVAIGVIDNGALPASAAARALLTADDVKHISGVEIHNGGETGVSHSNLPTYVSRNPVSDPGTVHPSRCADNLEGWMAWASLDTPSYVGWRHDTVYQAQNLVVDSATDFGPNIQQSRNFATVAAATAFVDAQRTWYRECAIASYSDPSDSTNSATYAFAPVNLNVGLDAVIEGSTDRGRNAPPHVIDVYLRNRNIVYALEVATTHDPAQGLDRASLAIIRAAANKLRSVG